LSTLRPARANATSCSLNSAGYRFLVLGMKNTLLLEAKSVHQTGGTPIIDDVLTASRARRTHREELMGKAAKLLADLEKERSASA
ncbi:MAG: hypothetical protein AAF250_16490, partial [Pseudomonadota bacterium]